MDELYIESQKQAESFSWEDIRLLCQPHHNVMQVNMKTFRMYIHKTIYSNCIVYEVLA